MNDPVDGLIVHLDDVTSGPGPASNGEVAQSGWAGGEDHLLPRPGDHGEAPGGECPGQQPVSRQVAQHSRPDHEFYLSDSSSNMKTAFH